MTDERFRFWDQSQTVAIYANVQSQVLLVGWDWDRHGDDKPGFGIDYYGTAKEPRAEQFAECLIRADCVSEAHLAVRLPDGNWIIGKVNP